MNALQITICAMLTSRISDAKFHIFAIPVSALYIYFILIFIDKYMQPMNPEPITLPS
jgi:hypothetical protein